MRQFTARDSGIDYENEFGINLNKLGCVMLDVEFVNPTFIRQYTNSLGMEPYVSTDPDQFWIDGITNEDELHVTLRYGLMPEVHASHAERIISLVEKPEDKVWNAATCRLGTFPGFSGEYFVLVLKMLTNNDGNAPMSNLEWYIKDCHNALGVLPNLATFSPPTFHVTLGYFKGEAPDLGNSPIFPTMRGKGIRYGKHMRP